MTECIAKCKKDFGAYIAWPNQPITIPDDFRTFEFVPEKLNYLGHAGVLLIEGGTGLTKYYEFGRYNAHGFVRTVGIPDVKKFRNSWWKNDWPSEEDIQNIISKLPSSKKGYKCRASFGRTWKTDGFNKMKEYAETFKNSPPKYNILTNNCSTFAQSVLRKGGIHGGFAMLPSLSTYTNSIRDAVSTGETHIYEKIN